MFSFKFKIRQATLDKLLERLTDLRFLSIDFLNTFLLTYRVFTDPMVILNALKDLYESSPKHSIELGEHDFRFLKLLSFSCANKLVQQSI